MSDEDCYAELKPIKGESRYLEWDDEFNWWGVFGSDSGFCYASFTSKQEANDYLVLK